MHGVLRVRVPSWVLKINIMLQEMEFKRLTKSEQADLILGALMENNTNRVMLYLKWSGMKLSDFQ